MDHVFCRIWLKGVMEDVRKVTTVEQRKQAWAWKASWGQDVEFHGPDDYYWYGRACCLWAARAEGWGCWLDKFHPEIGEELVKELEKGRRNNGREN